MPKQPKTSGKEWLYHSLMAFNGSGYADMSNPEDYLQSYIAYKTMHKKTEAVALAKVYGQELLSSIDKLLSKTYGAGRRPAQKHLNQLQNVREQHQESLF